MDRTEWMSSTEVAEAAGIDKQRVYKAIDTGGLPAYRIGRHYRFKRSEVATWLTRRDRVGRHGEDES